MATVSGAIARLFTDRRGGPAVEFAIALPIFLTLALGITELGRLMLTVHAMHDAAAGGARYAIVHGSESTAPATPDAIEAAVRAGAVIDQARLRVTVQEVADDGSVTTVAAGHVFDPGETIRIVTDYDFPFLVPVFNYDSLRLSRFMDMVVMH